MNAVSGKLRHLVLPETQLKFVFEGILVCLRVFIATAMDRKNQHSDISLSGIGHQMPETVNRSIRQFEVKKRHRTQAKATLHRFASKFYQRICDVDAR